MRAREQLQAIQERAALAERHLSICGYCDAGLPMVCTCATVDPRQTIMELIEAVRGQVAALRAVLDLHSKAYATDWPRSMGGPYCGLCQHPMPCPTVRAITEALS